AGDAVAAALPGGLADQVAGEERARRDSPLLEEGDEVVLGERRVGPHGDRKGVPAGRGARARAREDEHVLERCERREEAREVLAAARDEGRQAAELREPDGGLQVG